MWKVYKQWVTVINREREKLFFPVSVDPTFYFLINTEPSYHDRNEPERVSKAYIQIAQADYGAFLPCNSYVCCTCAFDNFVPDTNYLVGEIKGEDRIRVIKTVLKCPDLPKRTIMHIARCNPTISEPIIFGQQ